MVIFSERYFPVVMILPWGAWEAEDADRYLEAFRRLRRRGDLFLSLSDARWSLMPDARQRQEIADMAGQAQEINIAYTRGSVVVLASKLAVGAAMAVQWLTRKNDIASIYCTTAMAAFTKLETIAATEQLRLATDFRPLCRRLDELAAGKPTLEDLRTILE